MITKVQPTATKSGNLHEKAFQTKQICSCLFKMFHENNIIELKKCKI